MELRDKVKVALASIVPQLADKVAEMIAAAELQRQVTAIATVWERLRQAERKHSSVRPDLVTYTADGKVASEAWSKAALKAAADTKKEVDRLSNAIKEALNGDPQDVFNIANQRVGQGQGSSEANGSPD